MKKQVSLTNFFKRNEQQPSCQLTSYKSMENITQDIPPTQTAHTQLFKGKKSIFKQKDPVPSCTLISYKSTDNIVQDMPPTLIANTQPSQGKKRKYGATKKDYEANKRIRPFCHHWLRIYTWLAYC